MLGEWARRSWRVRSWVGRGRGGSGCVAVLVDESAAGGVSSDRAAQAVAVTSRADGSAPASVVNAGVLDHPVTGEPVVGFVARGGAQRPDASCAREVSQWSPPLRRGRRALRDRPRARTVGRLLWRVAQDPRPVGPPLNPQLRVLDGNRGDPKGVGLGPPPETPLAHRHRAFRSPR